MECSEIKVYSNCTDNPEIALLIENFQKELQTLGVICLIIDSKKVINNQSELNDFLNQIILMYHTILPNLPTVKSVSKKRRCFLLARIKEDPEERGKIDFWKQYFQKVSESDFLCGRVIKFRADFEWLIRPENFLKTFEGRYDNIITQPDELIKNNWLISLWNAHCKQLPKATIFTHEENEITKELWKSIPDEKYWIDIIQRIAKSKFCQGYNKNNWTASISYLLKKGVHVKIANGYLDNEDPYERWVNYWVKG